MQRLRSPFLALTALAGLVLAAAVILGAPATAQTGSRDFPQTGHTVEGRFLEYWEQHGGLAQQGYPVSDEIEERSDTNGQTYTVQYFERAVFERHPENARPYDVLLSLLGGFEYQMRYGAAGAPGQHASTDNPRYFAQTGHTVGGAFRTYWESHGGLAQQGYPLSDEFTEISALDGKPHTVQYFERAVFERHPENAGTPYEVLLAQLGTFRYRSHFGLLTVPAPAPNHFQSELTGSDSYLLWTDARNPGPVGATDSHIFGLELATSRPITVTTAPGAQLGPAVSGSLAVWEDFPSGCPQCENTTATILGKDLSTGQTFTVTADLANSKSRPAIAGRKVAWVENRTNGYPEHRLMLKDLDSGIAEAIYTNEQYDILLPPALSDEYLIWSDTQSSVVGSGTITSLRAYNLATRTTQVLTTLPYPTTTYAIADHRVVWEDAGVHFADLRTGERAVLAQGGHDPAIRGDTVVWVDVAGNAQAIWGLKLTDRHPVILLADPGIQERPTLAADWLTWASTLNSGASRVQGIALGRAFAAAPIATTTPVPPPTASATAYPFPLLTPSTTPGPSPRLYVPNAVSVPIAAGHYVFYFVAPHAPSATPGPSGEYINSIFAQDLATGEIILVKQSPGMKSHLVSNGQMLAWLEHPQDGKDSIRGFDLARRVQFPILGGASRRSFSGLALDSGTLYYWETTPGRTGIYAQSLATGQESLVTATGENPVAAGSEILWSVEQYVGSPPQLQVSLHLRRVGTNEDRIVVVGNSGFRSYGVAGDTVVWSFLPPVVDPEVHFYSISRNITRTLPTGPAVHVVAGERSLAWNEAQPVSPGQAPQYTIRTYSLDTGRFSTVSSDLPSYAEPWAIIENAVLFTVEATVPGDTRELYLSNIPGD